MKPRILVAGVGNIFLGDDAFGVEVVARLSAHEWPADVRVVDFGIRGHDLAYALLDGYEVAILVDAMPSGRTPGEVCVIEVEQGDASHEGPTVVTAFDPHRLVPAQVLQLVAVMGGSLGRLFVVGCEPTPLDEYDDIHPGLSAPVSAALPVAVQLIIELIGDLLSVPQHNSGDAVITAGDAREVPAFVPQYFRQGERP